MNKVIVLAAASFALALVACSSDDDDNAASSASALSVVDACSAEVTCNFDDGPKSARLTKDAAGCHMGGLTLAAGGVVVADDLDGVNWKSTTTTVSVCVDGAADVCITCIAGGTTTSSSNPAAGKCTGYPTSCSSLGPGSCSPQDGCSMDLDFRYCEGSARSCDEYDSLHSCVRQRGCSWK
jgi:hypothetical protein